MKPEEAERQYRMFWEWRLTNSPEFATSIGIHKFDNRLDEMNLSSYIRREDSAKTLLYVVKRFQAEHQDMPEDTALNINLILSDVEQFLEGQRFTPYMYPLNMLEGPQINFPRTLTWMKKDSVDDVMKILSRMRLFAQQIDETIHLLEEGIRLGRTMHEVSVKTLPNVLREMAECPVEESTLYQPFRERPEEITEKQWNGIVTEAKNVIFEVVNPAYIKLSDFIRDVYMGKTRSSIGASSLPDGEEYYAACLKFHTTTNLTPKQVHDIGLSEVKRITGRMTEVKEQVKFEGSLKDFRNYLRTDDKFNFSSAEEILVLYRNICKKIEQKLPEYFQVVPKAPYSVIPVPSEVAPTFPGAYYLAPPEDGSRPGTFMINTYKPESRKKYEAVALSLHESVPGHHLQHSLTMESGTMPEFRRFMEDQKYYEPPARFSMNTGYIEGWGLYSEYLGEEMELYTDPYDMFGRLSHEMLRACRLVVDTGMHAFNWSRDQAIEFMFENTASDMHDITSEIDRYITWPGQACGYKIGEIKIKEMRKKAEEKLGGKFNLKLFHHLVASMGGVPLNILETEIDSFIRKHST